MSPNFLTSWVSILLGLALVSRATARVERASPFAFGFHISVFLYSLFFTCHWISFVFLLYDRRFCTKSVDLSLIHFLCEFPGLGLALVPHVVVPEAEQRCTWSRNLVPNFCPSPGLKFEHWHLAATSVTTSPLRTPSVGLYYDTTSLSTNYILIGLLAII